LQGSSEWNPEHNIKHQRESRQRTSLHECRLEELHIKQGFEYLGNDRWRWWIWLGGSEGQVGQIESVTYILHPTFPNPVRTITDRATRFRLATAGWGIFRIRATAHRKDGTKIELHHDLVLEYPDGTATTA
jgi:transcription initiation factor IIF auxiliary subunit